MSVSHRTTTTVRAMPLLPAIQHATLETIEHGENIEDRLETTATVDVQSDQKLWEARRWLRLIRQDPANAAQYATLGEAALVEGMRLDDIEDEHRDAALGSAHAVQTIGRATVARLAERFGGGPEGA